MSDNALETAFNPFAPDDEQRDAMAQVQKAALPSSVAKMAPLINYVKEQYSDQAFFKTLEQPDIVPFPSKAMQDGEKKEMQSVWLDDRQVLLQGKYYEKPSGFNFDSMRMMVDRTPILSAVVMTRIRQVKRFCRANTKGVGPGFSIQLRDKQDGQKLKKQERDSIMALQGFFTNCGWESNPRMRQRLKRDNFSGFVGKIIRDSLVMDSAPIETEYKANASLGTCDRVPGLKLRLRPLGGY